MTIYLYVKTHKKTGLKYLGITAKTYRKTQIRRTQGKNAPGVDTPPIFTELKTIRLPDRDLGNS